MAIDPNTVINPKNLLAAFAGTRALKANDAAYQTIVKLINLIGENQTNITNNILNDQTAIIEINITIGNLKNADYVTWTNELGILPNSRQVLAGTNITLDTSIPGQITINSTGSSGGSSTSTGAIWIRDCEHDEPLFVPGTQGRDGINGTTGAQGPIGPSMVVMDGVDGEDSFIPGPIPQLVDSITFGADGAGTALTTSPAAEWFCPYAGTILANTIVADQSGSLVIGISKSTYAGFPGSLASIVASAAPTLSSAQKSTDSTLTGWTISFAAGDVFKFTISSVSTITRFAMTLTVRKV